MPLVSVSKLICSKYTWHRNYSKLPDAHGDCWSSATTLKTQTPTSRLSCFYPQQISIYVHVLLGSSVCMCVCVCYVYVSVNFNILLNFAAFLACVPHCLFSLCVFIVCFHCLPVLQAAWKANFLPQIVQRGFPVWLDAGNCDYLHFSNQEGFQHLSCSVKIKPTNPSLYILVICALLTTTQAFEVEFLTVCFYILKNL